MTFPPIPPVGTPDEFTNKVPDVAETLLAFRVWRFDRARNLILSLNAPMFRQRVNPGAYGVAMALSSEPEGGWPPAKRLEAKCDRAGQTGPPPHKEPDSCGIYATTSMDVVNVYLAPDAPVLGVVELGGKYVPGTQGFRAQFARLAAVLLVDPVVTIQHSRLQSLADHYQVPALVPHSIVPEDYRERLVQSTFADEVEEFLRGQR